MGEEGVPTAPAHGRRRRLPRHVRRPAPGRRQRVRGGLRGARQESGHADRCQKPAPDIPPASRSTKTEGGEVCRPGRQDTAPTCPSDHLVSRCLPTATPLEPQSSRMRRSRPSGSSTMRLSLSNTMVSRRAELVGVQARPGWLGSPVRRNWPRQSPSSSLALRLGRIPRALLAALGVVEAESQLRGVPGARDPRPAGATAR